MPSGTATRDVRFAPLSSHPGANRQITARHRQAVQARVSTRSYRVLLWDTFGTTTSRFQRHWRQRATVKSMIRINNFEKSTPESCLRRAALYPVELRVLAVFLSPNQTKAPSSTVSRCRVRDTSGTTALKSLQWPPLRSMPIPIGRRRSASRPGVTAGEVYSRPPRGKGHHRR